jgi:hypothetical protein
LRPVDSDTVISDRVPAESSSAHPRGAYGDATAYGSLRLAGEPLRVAMVAHPDFAPFANAATKHWSSAWTPSSPPDLSIALTNQPYCDVPLCEVLFLLLHGENGQLFYNKHPLSPSERKLPSSRFFLR